MNLRNIIGGLILVGCLALLASCERSKPFTCQCYGATVSCVGFPESCKRMPRPGTVTNQVSSNEVSIPNIGSISVRCSIGTTQCNGIATSCSSAKDLCSCPEGGELICSTISSDFISTTAIINNITYHVENNDTVHSASVDFNDFDSVEQTIYYDNDTNPIEYRIKSVNASDDRKFNFYYEKMHAN